MLGKIAGMLGNFLPGNLGGGREVASRQEMLRHTEFYQFGRQVFGKESSPHELHWGIRDALLDGGAKVDDESLPSPTSHWAMTPSELVGKNTGCEADYMPFSGSLRATKGRLLSSKFWLIVVIGVLTSPIIVGVFILLGCSIYYGWVRKYHNGTLLARYDGVYRRPASGGTTASGVKNWEFQVDVMLSYRVETPPFGLPALGPEIVTPVFQHAIAKTVEYAKSGVLQVRTQPQLVSARSAAFEDRFPVNYGEISTPTTTAYTHEPEERPSI